MGTYPGHYGTLNCQYGSSSNVKLYGLHVMVPMESSSGENTVSTIFPWLLSGTRYCCGRILVRPTCTRVGGVLGAEGAEAPVTAAVGSFPGSSSSSPSSE
jgi:hypothetical protein